VSFAIVRQSTLKPFNTTEVETKVPEMYFCGVIFFRIFDLRYRIIIAFQAHFHEFSNFSFQFLSWLLWYEQLQGFPFFGTLIQDKYKL
jgi:hypothetical protein